MKNESWIQVVKFTLLSLSAAVVDTASFFLLKLIFPTMSIGLRQTISVILSVLWNFTLNRRYTFKSSNNIPIAMLKVAVFYVIFIPISSWVSTVLSQMGVSEVIIKGLTLIANGIGEFIWWKFVVFKGSENTNDLAKK
ncbi:GtrA family protein [Guggenheimella bovis]